VFFEDARTSYTLERIKRILSRTIDTIGVQLGASSFSAEGYEMSFETVKDLDDIHLRGRIDRIDTKEEDGKLHVRVIDYKSGNTRFQLLSLYHGLQLQLVVYLNAAVEILQGKYPEKEIQPAGMFYYHMDDPVIDVKGKEPEEIVKAKIQEQLALEGMALDGSAGVDSDVSKKSQKAGEEEFRILSDFVKHKIRTIGKEIYQGEIQAAPYSLNDKTGCDYCPYHGICGFDEKLPGESYRKLDEFKDVMELIKDEINS
jgi:ATP-dependent helicase/nuclease subunit B